MMNNKLKLVILELVLIALLIAFLIFLHVRGEELRFNCRVSYNVSNACPWVTNQTNSPSDLLKVLNPNPKF